LLLLQLFVDFSLPATPKNYRNEQLTHPRRRSRRSLRPQDVADLLRLLLLRRRHPIPAHRARPPRQAPQSSWHASPGGCNSDSSAGSPWKMTIPRVSGLSMTTRSSSGVSPSAGPDRTTPKTMGKRAVPRRSSPSSAPPALRRSPS
ncbi:unnamed protein product, partial [Musa hybrid cultivar]